MRFFRQGLGILAFIVALGVSGTAFAAAGDKLADKGKIDQAPAVEIAFGDDAGSFANDGECDDPRFTGPGAGKRPAAADRMHDATDCAAAVTAGTVTYDGEPLGADIDFGDDTSSYANNSECDDPRFEGASGMASVLLESDSQRDATDCRALYESGTIALIAIYRPGYADGAPYDASGITFGNDTSSYANNTDCDDPRFIGPGLASSVLDDDLLKDATDCEAAYIAGTVVLKSGAEANPDVDLTVYTSTTDPSIGFGENTSDYKNNGECDDPRFEGAGMASVLNTSDMMKDAKDCSELFDAGTVTILPVFGGDYVNGAPYDSAGLDFGDNSSDYKDNSECDDPRFMGPGVAEVLLDEDLLRDASDCRTVFEAGRAVLKPDAEAKPDTTVYTSAKDPAIAFGDNTSEYKDNGECDDPRFAGEGVAGVLSGGDMLRDAKDCSQLFDTGTITLIAVYHPDYAAGAPYDSAGVEFGDDTSSYANNSECDDPRFAGPGMASVLLDEDASRDATDCKAAFEAGTAALKTAETTTPDVVADVIDYGDDTSDYANDGECDDPRFAGEGAADVLVNDDLARDATDCRTNVAAGTITLLPVYAPNYAEGAPFAITGIDFGDNTSSYKDNGECDDPRFVGPGMAPRLSDTDQLRDAVDCKAAFTAGQVMLKTAAVDAELPVTPAAASGIDFGDDTSDYANNSECDDRRFAGDGMDDVLLAADVARDATDCRALVESGRIRLMPVFGADYVNGAPYDAAGVDFGDNTSDYKDNNECDDPRFAGPGMASTVLEEDTLRDAADCRVKFEAGLVAMKE